MENQGFVTIGRITGKHGVKGAVKLFPLTDFPERFLEMKELRLYDSKGKPVIVLNISRIRFLPDKRYYLVETNEIKNPEEADSVKGLMVKIPLDERVELKDGEFWIDDIVGLNVVMADTNEKFGVIEDVITNGDSDLYLVRDLDDQIHYIPAVREFVKKIDIPNGCIEVDLIEGQ